MHRMARSDPAIEPPTDLSAKWRRAGEPSHIVRAAPPAAVLQLLGIELRIACGEVCRASLLEAGIK